MTDDKVLRGVLTYHWGDYGLPPETASWAIHCMVGAQSIELLPSDLGGVMRNAMRVMQAFLYCMQVAQHYITGAAYPTGGAAELARRIIPTIEAAGGKVLVRAPVQSVLVDDRCDRSFDSHHHEHLSAGGIIAPWVGWGW
eukprot:SAG11_NODE_1267_length_5342_cov_1.772459_4_plen_140_part_00